MPKLSIDLSARIVNAVAERHGWTDKIPDPEDPGDLIEGKPGKKINNPTSREQFVAALALEWMTGIAVDHEAAEAERAQRAKSREELSV